MGEELSPEVREEIEEITEDVEEYNDIPEDDFQDETEI